MKLIILIDKSTISNRSITMLITANPIKNILVIGLLCG